MISVKGQLELARVQSQVVNPLSSDNPPVQHPSVEQVDVRIVNQEHLRLP